MAYENEPLPSVRQHVGYLRDGVADEPELRPDLADAETALRLREGAEPIRVTVFTHDGRPAYVGAGVDLDPCDRAVVENPDTGERVSVAYSSLAPEGAELECDCDSCLALWKASGLA